MNQVQFGAGPGQSNTGADAGEGLHAASNFLFDGGAPSTLTILFNTPVLGAGLFIIDYFNPLANNPLTIEAFTGSNGTGTSLGSFSSVIANFQPNRLYFMGLVSTNNDIRSLVFNDVNSETGDTTGIDDILFSQIPEPGSIVLLPIGLLAVFGHGWRKRKRAA